MNRFTGIVNNPSKGLFDKAKNRTGKWAEDREHLRETNALTGKTKNGETIDSKGLYARAKRRANKRNNIAKHHEEDLKSLNKGAYGSYMGSEASSVARDVAKNTGNRGSSDSASNFGQLSSSGRSAIKNREEALANTLGNTSIQIDIDSIEAGEARFENEQHTMEELHNAYENGVDKNGNQITETERSAARNLLAKYGSQDDIHKLIDDISREGNATAAREAFARSVAKNPAARGQVHLSAQGIRQGKNVGQLFQQAVANNLYTASNLAGQSTTSMQGLAQHKTDDSGSTQYEQENIEFIRKQMQIAQSKTEYSSKFTRDGMRHGRSI